MPQSLTTPSTSELLIKKSHFIGCLQPVVDLAAAHVCWAEIAHWAHLRCCLGADGAVNDGEPSGTAGRPMLEVLRHQESDSQLGNDA